MHVLTQKQLMLRVAESRVSAKLRETLYTADNYPPRTVKVLKVGMFNFI